MLDARVVEKFWSLVQKLGPDECWPWLGSRLPRGYGTFAVANGRRGGEKFYAHRVAFAVGRGIIDPGLMVLHSCDNPPCCNERHLFQGTGADNVHDMWRKGRGTTPFGTKYIVGIGEDHPVAKLDAAKVVRIRLLRASGLKLEEIAADVGVGKSTISRVVNRSPVGGWAHV